MHTAALRDEPLSNLHPDIIQQWLGELRAGAENARIVANELDQAAERLLTQAKEVATRSAAPAPPEAHFIGEANPDLWAEAKLALSRLNVKKRMPEAVKCLHLLLATNVSATAIVARQRPKSYAISSGELHAKMERLSENDQQYMTGYIQGLVDGRST
jgi:hypothetical protein